VSRRRRGIRHFGYHARHAWRSLTAPWRRLPDFLIVGSQKSGTTSLYSYICGHPNVVRALEKEIRYFGKRRGYSPRWYRAHFPLRGRRPPEAGPGPVLCGEATPGYLQDPQAPAQAAALLPEARVLAILRNPVDRAFSHYQHLRRRNRVDLPFADYAERLGDRPDRFFRQGLYADGVGRWQAAFGADRVLVIQAEPFFAAPAEGMEPVFHFLGLEPVARDQYKAHMSGGYSETLDPDLRRRLLDFFSPHNERLYDLLGRRFEGWDR
jgi:hypothetical protein